MAVLAIVLCLLLMIPVVLFVRDWYVRARFQQVISAKYSKLKGILQTIAAGSPVSESSIRAIAMAPSLRLALYRALEAYQRDKLFPRDLYTEEKGAESYLVNWLEFPTELGRPPDEIVLAKIVEIDSHQAIRYYVFKFRASSPAWARKSGWMLGVCGPYDPLSKPFDIPNKIFSRFNPVELTTPEEEVQWVHDTIKVRDPS